MNAKQRVIGFSLTIGYVAWFYLSPETAINSAAIAVASVFAVIIAMRFWTALAAMMRKPAQATPRANDDDLPTLSVLVPLYREARVVPQLIAAISRLDYPRRLLDVKLLVEADDPETIAAVEAQPLPAGAGRGAGQGLRVQALRASRGGERGAGSALRAPRGRPHLARRD